jgi:hypothetical protein
MLQFFKRKTTYLSPPTLPCCLNYDRKLLGSVYLKSQPGLKERSVGFSSNICSCGPPLSCCGGPILDSSCRWFHDGSLHLKVSWGNLKRGTDGREVPFLCSVYKPRSLPLRPPGFEYSSPSCATILHRNL